MCLFSSGAVFIIQCFVLLIQYMISALSDCVPVIQQVKHESSAQVMLDTFEKEISDTLHEVRRLALFSIHFILLVCFTDQISKFDSFTTEDEGSMGNVNEAKSVNKV